MFGFIASFKCVFNKKVKYFTLATLAASLVVLPVYAQSRLTRLVFIYPPLNLSLGIDSLELFAKEGLVNNELAFYMNLAGVNEAQKEAFRQALLKKADLDPVEVSRFFNTPMGEELLTRVGKLFSIQGGRNGKYAMRGAMVQAAFDEKEGLTLLNFLRHLAVNMQFNLLEVFEAASLLERLGEGTNAIVAEMKVLSSQQAQLETVPDFSTLGDIRQQGSYGVAPTRQLRLFDESRQREFNLLLVQPQRWREGKTPVVILSHGLASRPEDFEQRAKQLASYGFVVALPQHPGSDFNQLQAMLQGFSREVFKVNEFIDRPKDVSYVIDELERRNSREFGGRLDLNNVGVMGHSFGGYNALAVAGASLNFATLEETCNQDIWGPNLSLLLQCRALELPRKDYNFRDERVTSVLVINPVTSAVFGAEGLSNVTIPVMLGAGSSDPATPAAIEQLKAFVWINTDDKYFVLVEGQAHVNFSQLDGQMQAVLDSLPDLKLPKQQILDTYGNALLVAFAEVHTAKNEKYRSFLTASYGNYISRQPNPMYLVGNEAEFPLSELFNSRRTSRIPAIYPRNFIPNHD
ncbi:alpha/beta hydrolase [Cyanothece sp. BG0011]|uniref:alpha/beta hydrolase n=1 Tax=Cyanothece sp. BG0011 TaxID=2082950 RepID=UPI000D1DE760|nr:alpha/beta hydrolase [Cyanothece sp. BG0011]